MFDLWYANPLAIMNIATFAAWKTVFEANTKRCLIDY